MKVPWGQKQSCWMVWELYISIHFKALKNSTTLATWERSLIFRIIQVSCVYHSGSIYLFVVVVAVYLHVIKELKSHTFWAHHLIHIFINKLSDRKVKPETSVPSEHKQFGSGPSSVLKWLLKMLGIMSSPPVNERCVFTSGRSCVHVSKMNSKQGSTLGFMKNSFGHRNLTFQHRSSFFWF